MQVTSAVRRIADDYVLARANHEPTAAQAIGISASNQLPDLSSDWAHSRRELDAETAKTLAQLPASEIPPQDQALFAALKERLDSDVVLFDSGFTARLLGPLATPVHEIRETFDDVTVTADAAGDAILEKLSGVPAALEALRGRLEWARAEGARGRFSGGGVAARRQVIGVADQIASWVAPAGLAYFESIKTNDLDAAREVLLAKSASAASIAFTRFEFFLRSDLAPSGSDQDAVGQTVYQATSRAFLGVDLDLDEIYDFGWTELERLTARAKLISSKISGLPVQPGIVRRAVDILDSDPANILDNRDSIRDWLRTRVDATTEKLNGIFFDMPAGIDEVDYIVTEAASGVVYYIPSAPDNSRKSQIVWTIPRGQKSISAWREVTAVHHEGIPGHHLEHAINRANTALHPWQRYLCEVHGYAEGWAHYSEGLAEDLGLLENLGEQLSMVLGQVWRTVRIIVDLGLHTRRPIPRNGFTDATTWSENLGRSFLHDLAGVDFQTASFEVERYLAWPGQALAFKVGSKLWGDARIEATQKARAGGRKLSLKEFHSDALALGPMGLAPLSELMLGHKNDERPVR